jgi:hypothetical protein
MLVGLATVAALCCAAVVGGHLWWRVQELATPPACPLPGPPAACVVDMLDMLRTGHCPDCAGALSTEVGPCVSGRCADDEVRQWCPRCDAYWADDGRIELGPVHRGAALVAA